MSIFTILETILIGPLKLLFEIIFSIANLVLGNPGLAIMMLSLTMNILVLPLYRRADAMQEQARDTDAKLRHGVTHIKKTFSGDERMMILQTYYRQNHYKPTDALNGSAPLLLEIPFFMAAYQFLSHLTILDGVSLGPIQNLMAPDGLLVIGGIAINVLPILMTVINLISSFLYSRDFPLKTKIQLFAMAAFFLVFLYDSPSCLVFYWTLNNVFSLIKTIFYQLKHPRRVINLLSSAVGVCLLYIYKTRHLGSPNRQLLVLLLGLLLQFPLLVSLAAAKGLFRQKIRQFRPNHAVFLLGAVFLTVLVGMLIPSALMADSPQEFISPSLHNAPLWYVASCLCLAAGTFLVWMGVIYWLARPAGKVWIGRLVWISCGITLVNYMFFGTRLGTISADLLYDNGLIFSRQEKILNLIVLAVVALLMYVCITKWSRGAAFALVVAAVALSGMSAWNLSSIKSSLEKVDVSDISSGSIPEFQLSTTGKNVVVMMLDRAMASYVPYLFQEKPELQEQFSGFTFYDNTISFAGSTNIASPALFGGYEYTPVEMNRRDSETMVSKHNEALKVMPVLFAENGYDVTVCNPVYANYQWIPDLSIFDEYPDIQAYNTARKFHNAEQVERAKQSYYRNFFCFSIMKCLPVSVQFAVYDRGRYYQVLDNYTSQTQTSISEATGISRSFMEAYQVLTNLSTMTKFTDEDVNTYVSLVNDTPHEPLLLQTPDYTPAQTVDNREYDAAHADRFTVDGKTLNMDDPLQMTHYHVNMATFLQLGEWFDALRANHVYDNTRIILAADHGRNLSQHDELIHDDGTGRLIDTESYYPMLMVKDFDQEGFTVSHEFMTNADVPTLATQDLIQDPQNPFTGKPITNDEKTAHEQLILLSLLYGVDDSGKDCTFPSDRWAGVKDDLWDPENWTFYHEEFIPTPHTAP